MKKVKSQVKICEIYIMRIANLYKSWSTLQNVYDIHKHFCNNIHNW